MKQENPLSRGNSSNLNVFFLLPSLSYFKLSSISSHGKVDWLVGSLFYDTFSVTTLYSVETHGMAWRSAGWQTVISPIKIRGFYFYFFTEKNGEGVQNMYHYLLSYTGGSIKRTLTSKFENTDIKISGARPFIW
jgi:hypothetical protein